MASDDPVNSKASGVVICPTSESESPSAPRPFTCKRTHTATVMLARSVGERKHTAWLCNYCRRLQASPVNISTPTVKTKMLTGMSAIEAISRASSPRTEEMIGKPIRLQLLQVTVNR